jgi:sulfane dehydrogenase subunit SoxC
VRLALRNAGMPLEALRRSITPIGMHYVLVHSDLPEVDTAACELVVDGRVRNSLALTLDEAGGRIWRRVRSVAREAIGCAEWTGTPLRGVPEDAGLLDDSLRQPLPRVLTHAHSKQRIDPLLWPVP